MKYGPRGLSATAAVAAAALFGVTPAFAQVPQYIDQYAVREPAGPYAGLAGGAHWLDSFSASGPAGRDFKLKFHEGPVGLGSLGYAFGNGLRAEVEFGYRHSDAKSLELPSGVTLPSSLDLKTNALIYTYMVNGIYDFRLTPAWSANIGAGVGAAMVRVNNVGHDTPFAYQAIAGVEYAVTPQMRLGIGYRYLGSESINLRENASTFVSSHPQLHDHNALVTFRYIFNDPRRSRAAEVPPPPPPAPPAAPAGTTARPPFSRNYDIYFATSSAALTPAAMEILRQAATDAKDNAPTRINVAGHTDTTGPASYNERLSGQRAEAVRRELIANGVPPDEITTAAQGESELAVPTGNGVREPRNRRVVISVQSPGV